MAFNETYGIAPVTRYTPDDRLLWFTQNAPIIYNKYSPYTNNGFGPSSPLVYFKLTDTSPERYKIAQDTQATPYVSTRIDVRRVGKFLKTNDGINFLINQNYAQSANAFTETRVYNPLSVVAAAKSTGLLDRFGPTRHQETNGVLSYFVSSGLSLFGLNTTLSGTNNLITGTATGEQGSLPYSKYVGAFGARSGLLRFPTANNARVMFDYVWNNGTIGNNNGFLSNLARAIVKKALANVPTTNPMGALGGDPKNKWKYRPEYNTSDDGKGVYEIFRKDSAGLLSSKVTQKYGQFYNAVDAKGVNQKNPGEYVVKKYHNYFPDSFSEGKSIYATKDKIIQENENTEAGLGIGYVTSMGSDFNAETETVTDYKYFSSLKNVYSDYIASMQEILDRNAANPQLNRSAETYASIRDNSGYEYSPYKNIPGGNSTGVKFTQKNNIKNNDIESKKWFARAKSKGIASKIDEYNALGILKDKTKLDEENNPNQSRDLIYFYFYDLINEVYVPFRATLTSLSDQNSADWEDIHYMGRADKLFVYKGFSRDVNFAFSVYANSAEEMLPMWNRINYLVGFTRPSKYTAPVQSNITKALQNNREESSRIKEQLADLEAAYQENPTGTDSTEYLKLSSQLDALNFTTNALNDSMSSAARATSFMYPSMVTFRLGDMFVDQPAVIQSVSVTVPDDTNWETDRTGNNRQLPLKVDISVTLKLMEKRQSLGKDPHYGKIGNDGTEWAI